MDQLEGAGAGNKLEDGEVDDGLSDSADPLYKISMNASQFAVETARQRLRSGQDPAASSSFSLERLPSLLDSDDPIQVDAGTGNYVKVLINPDSGERYKSADGHDMVVRLRPSQLRALSRDLGSTPQAVVILNLARQLEADNNIGRLEERAHRFLGPQAEMALPDQIELMQDLWEWFGYDLHIPDKQRYALEHGPAANPLNRLFIHPLTDLERFQELPKIAAYFPKSKTIKKPWSDNIVLPHPGSTPYGRLLRYPDVDTSTDNRRQKYGLYYYAQDGRLVKRQEFIRSLLAGGQAVRGYDGTVWLFPVISRSPTEAGTTSQPKDLHQAVGYLATRELNLIRFLLHQITGTPNGEEAYTADHTGYLANEAVYAYGRRGRMVLHAVSILRPILSGKELVLGSWQNVESPNNPYLSASQNILSGI